MCLWNSLAFFVDPTNVGILISDFSAFSKSSLNIWRFTVHVLLKPCLENFEHYFTSVWDECNCAVVNTLLILLLYTCFPPLADILQRGPDICPYMVFSTQGRFRLHKLAKGMDKMKLILGQKLTGELESKLWVMRQLI